MSNVKDKLSANIRAVKAEQEPRQPNSPGCRQETRGKTTAPRKSPKKAPAKGKTTCAR